MPPTADIRPVHARYEPPHRPPSPFAPPRSALVRPLWIAVTVLSLVGLATVVARLSFPDDLVLRAQPLRLRALEAIGRPDRFVESRLPMLERFERRFAEHRTLTRWHIVPGGLFIVLAPLQFARRVRRRFPALHRWSGRLLVATGTVAAVTGLWFGLVMPIAGLAESSIIALVSALFLVAIVRAFRAIRRRDEAAHREWMLRAFAVMAAVPATRVVGVLLDVAFAPTGVSSDRLFAVDLWLTWTLVLATTEWWIRRTRRLPRPATT